MNFFTKKYNDFNSAKDAEVVLPERDSSKYSMIVNSFGRTQNVRKIIDRYLNYEKLDDIIVWHNGEKQGNDWLSADPKLRIIQSDDLGLSSRFAGALLAKNDVVFLQDDDIISQEESLLFFKQKLEQSGGRTITTEGKNFYKDGSYGKVVKPKKGKDLECEIHLNRLICTYRKLVPCYFEFLERTNLSISPKAGGGEDIVYSYAVRENLGLKPLAVHIDYQDLPEDFAISLRGGNQHRNRTKVAKICQQVMKFDK